jgi:hypothetical protein
MNIGTRVGLVACLLGMSALASDEASKPYQGNGWVAFGIGQCQHRVTNISFSGGGDAFLWRGLTAGGEIGYYNFPQDRSAGFGIANANLGYHWVNRRNPGKWEPFVNAGIIGAGFAGGGAAASSGLGAGVNYWIKPRVALRTEARVTGFAEEAIVIFRIGLTFR